MRVSTVLALALSALSTVSAVTPPARAGVDIAVPEPTPEPSYQRLARQDQKADEGNKADSSANSDSNNEKQPDAPKDDKKDNVKAEETGKGTSTGKPTGTSKSTKTPTFDPRLPAGGIQMITPAPIEGPQFYKIGEFITFAWNYTSLSVTPSAVNVLASCSVNQQTYTISAKMPVKATGKVVWDTAKYQEKGDVPLLTEKYTLIIHDASKEVGDVAKSGYLGTFNAWTFGLYLPQPYTPLDEYECATCIGDATAKETLLIRSMVLVSVLTVLSFTWFSTGRFALV